MEQPRNRLRTSAPRCLPIRAEALAWLPPALALGALLLCSRAHADQEALRWCMREVYPTSWLRVDRSRLHEENATVAMQNNDMKTAAAEYEQGYRDNPCKLTFLILLGDAHLRNSDAVLALAAYERYLVDRARYDKDMLVPPKRRELARAHALARACADKEREQELEILQRRFTALDVLTARGLQQPKARAELYLVQARVKIFLRDWSAALDALESFQRFEPKTADPRVADSYERIDQGVAGASASAEALHLQGRVNVGRYLHQRATGEIPTDGYLERAVDLYSQQEEARARAPVAAGPRSLVTQQRYHTLRGLLREVGDADKSKRRLQLYLARITALDGEPRIAHALCQAHKDAARADEADKLQRWCHAVTPPPPPRCNKTCKILVGVGVGAAATALGVGLYLGLRPDPQIIPITNALGGSR